jgi:hypothetical protein
MLINERITHPLLIELLPLQRRQRLCGICIVRAATVSRHPNTRTDIQVPSERLIGIGVELPPNAVANCSRFLRDIVRRKRTLAGPQVSAALLDFGELQCMKSFCLDRVARA